MITDEDGIAPARRKNCRVRAAPRRLGLRRAPVHLWSLGPGVRRGGLAEGDPCEY